MLWGGTEPLIVRYDHDVEISGETYAVYDKTWQEVKDAYDAGTPVYYDSLFEDNGDTYYVRVYLSAILQAGNGDYAAFFAGTNINTSSVFIPMCAYPANANGYLSDVCVTQ